MITKTDREAIVSSDLFAICESIRGNWHYHLFYRKTGEANKAICGAQTMYSGAPVDSWGFKPEHMPTSYCSKCEEIAVANAIALAPATLEPDSTRDVIGGCLSRLVHPIPSYRKLPNQ